MRPGSAEYSEMNDKIASRALAAGKTCLQIADRTPGGCDLHPEFSKCIGTRKVLSEAARMSSMERGHPSHGPVTEQARHGS